MNTPDDNDLSSEFPDESPAGSGEKAPPSGEPHSPDAPALTPEPPRTALTPGMITPGGTPGMGLLSPGMTPTEAEKKDEEVPGKKWVKLQRLGSGGFGEVWKVRYLNSEEAWKFLPKKPGSSMQAFRETFNARSINHPNIVRIQDVLEENDFFIIRMDLVRGRNLHTVVNEDGVFQPEVACRHAVHLAGALESAHKAGVLHLDLKPSNILLKDDGDKVMITDFGISATMEKGLFQLDAASHAGTPYFLAPEQVESGEGTGGQTFGPGVDVWALGITLYFLLSRTYPFPFKENDPTIILKEPPKPLPEVLPYISDSLWSILEKMLARDPGERYQNMMEVRSAFTGYLTEITCPACNRTFPLDHVHGVCPEVNCPDPPRVVALNEKRQLMRVGHSYFARSEHLKAAETYGRVIQLEESGTKEYTERARRLSTIAEADARALAQRLEVIRGATGGGDLLRSIKEVDRARLRFSASTELLEQRQEVLGQIRERYETVVPTTSRMVKETRFADAKLLLTQIEGFLGYEAVRRWLNAWEESNDRESPPVQDLFNFVEEREEYHQACMKELSMRLGALELQKAAVCLQRVQKYFPSSKCEERIRIYTDLQEALDFTRKCDPEAIERILEADEAALPKERVELNRVHKLCETLEEALADNEVDLAEIEQRREGVARIIQQLRGRADRLQARAEAAERENRLRDRKAAIEGLVGIADLTDLFSIEEAARIRGLQEKLAGTLQRAEEKFQEGLDFIKGNHYGQAQVALETAENIAPGLFPEIPDKIGELKKLQDENRAISERMYQMYNRVMGETATLEDFKTFFMLHQESVNQQEKDTQADLEEKSSRVFSRLFTVQGNELNRAEQPGARLVCLRETVDVVVGRPEKLLALNLHRAGSKLNERLLEFFGRIFGPLERAGESRDKPDMVVDHVREVMAEMGRMKECIKALKPLEYHPHPGERVSTVLVGLRAAIQEGQEPRERLGALLTLHRELADFVEDAQVLRQIEKGGDTIKRSIRRVTAEKVLRRIGRISARAAIPVSTALAVAIVAYIYLQARKQEERSRLAVDILRPAADAYDVKLKAITGSALEKVEESNKELADFIRPLMVVGRKGDEEKTSTLEALGRWAGRRQMELLGLGYIAGAANAEAANKLKAERGKIEVRIAEKIEAYLVERLQQVRDEGMRQDFTAPLMDLRGAIHREMAGCGKLAAAFDPAEGSRLHRVIQALGRWKDLTRPGATEGLWTGKAEDWKRWLTAAKGNSSAAAQEKPEKSVDGAFLEVWHLSCIVEAVRNLSWKSHAMYWDEKKAKDFVEYLSSAVDVFVKYGEHLRTTPRLAELLDKVSVHEDISDDIGRGVWKQVLAAMKSER